MYKLRTGDDGYTPYHIEAVSPNIFDPRYNLGQSRWIRNCYQRDFYDRINNSNWSRYNSSIYLGMGTILDKKTLKPYILRVDNGPEYKYIIDKALYRNKNFPKAIKVAESAIKKAYPNNYEYGDISQYIVKPEKRIFKSPKAKREKEAEILKRFRETKEFERDFTEKILTNVRDWHRRENLTNSINQLFNF
jgi:hypothetical protein